MQPELTVAIPTYNRSNTLVYAIESVLNQTYRDFNLLILDNFSNDDTEQKVKAFDDRRIRYVKNESNIGWLNNTNKAIELCDTEYLVIFHDDDMMKPEMLAKQIGIMKNDNSIAVVGVNMELMDDDRKSLNRNFLQIKDDAVFNRFEYISSFYKYGIVLPCPSVMFRKSILKDNNIIFRDYIGHCADSFLWNEINTYNNKTYLFAEPLMNYRYHENESDIQKNLAIGKNYRHQIALHKYTYKLAEKFKLKKIIPLILLQRDHYLNLLIEDFVNSKISQEEFINEINTEPFYNISLRLSIKIKVFLIKKIPAFIIFFEKLKSKIRVILIQGKSN